VNRIFNIVIVFAVILMVRPVQAQTAPQPTPDPNSTKLGSITGRVLVEGQAVNNASIVVTRVGANTPTRYVPSNDNGDFEAKGLEAGLYQINVAAPGYVTSFNEDEYHRVGDSVTLTMQKGAVITGKVLNESDQPVIAVRVRALRIRDENGKPVLAPDLDSERLTDDRGVYRIFGLRPGTYLVSAGGRGPLAFGINGFDQDAPTYAPSSTRDTATTISLAGSEEKSVDIHYRGDSGHRVSGSATVPVRQDSPWVHINLARLINGTESRTSTYQNADVKGFEFFGVEDGDYLIWAQYSPAHGELLVSDPRRVTMKGADVTGLELVVKPLASIAGEVALIPSTAPACKGKRQPAFDETVIAVQRKQKPLAKPEPETTPPIPWHRFAQVTPDNSANFLLPNLGPGQFEFDVRFFAHYWYLQSISQRTTAKEAANKPVDLARTLLTLKSGERAGGVKVTLAAGAASLEGKVEASDSQPLPAGLFVYIVPADKERVDDPLRYSVAPVNADGSFAIEQLAPGRYWLITRVAADNLSGNKSLRSTDAVDARLKLRREAEAAKAEVALEPCQNVTGHKLSYLK
jgi:hypothetical protein